jgi:hypothetical protein
VVITPAFLCNFDIKKHPEGCLIFYFLFRERIYSLIFQPANPSMPVADIDQTAMHPSSKMFLQFSETSTSLTSSKHKNINQISSIKSTNDSKVAPNSKTHFIKMCSSSWKSLSSFGM